MLKRNSLLLVGLLSVFLLSSAGAQTPPFTNTTIVNGNLAPVANGAALLAAVAAATPPALIKVEPGTYDLNGGQLIMQDFVDVEGSGRDVTFITSDVSASFSNSTVLAPSGITAELRGLTVQNTSAGSGTGVRIQSDFFLLTGINVETETGGAAIGVEGVNCNTVIDDVFARVLGNGPNVGFRFNGGTPILRTSFAFVVGPSLRNIALEVVGDTNTQVEALIGIAGAGGDDFGAVIRDKATVELRNTRLTALATAPGINPNAFGLLATGEASVDIKESTLTAVSDTLAVALELGGETRGKVKSSTFIANPAINDHFNVYGVRLTARANLDSNQSNFESSSVAASNLGAGTGRFGTSQLIGSISAFTPTAFQCIFSYNGSYTARNANCF